MKKALTIIATLLLIAMVTGVIIYKYNHYVKHIHNAPPTGVHAPYESCPDVSKVWDGSAASSGCPHYQRDGRGRKRLRRR